MNKIYEYILLQLHYTQNTSWHIPPEKNLFGHLGIHQQPSSWLVPPTGSGGKKDKARNLAGCAKGEDDRKTKVTRVLLSVVLLPNSVTYSDLLQYLVSARRRREWMKVTPLGVYFETPDTWSCQLIMEVRQYMKANLVHIT